MYSDATKYHLDELMRSLYNDYNTSKLAGYKSKKNVSEYDKLLIDFHRLDTYLIDNSIKKAQDLYIHINDGLFVNN